MHAAAISPRGGVSPRGTLLRGQSIIEYVLIIAVIGLVIVFAGPQVSGAIRNQFNLVGNTVNSGTAGGIEGGGASGGADSATVQAAIAKDAKDWTLDEQEQSPKTSPPRERPRLRIPRPRRSWTQARYSLPS